jgi:hypothetical protein
MFSGLSTLYGCTESVALNLKVSFVIRVSKFLPSQEAPSLKDGKLLPRQKLLPYSFPVQT